MSVCVDSEEWTYFRERVDTEGGVVLYFTLYVLKPFVL